MSQFGQPLGKLQNLLTTEFQENEPPEDRDCLHLTFEQSLARINDISNSHVTFMGTLIEALQSLDMDDSEHELDTEMEDYVNNFPEDDTPPLGARKGDLKPLDSGKLKEHERLTSKLNLFNHDLGNVLADDKIRDKRAYLKREYPGFGESILKNTDAFVNWFRGWMIPPSRLTKEEMNSHIHHKSELLYPAIFDRVRLAATLLYVWNHNDYDPGTEDMRRELRKMTESPEARRRFGWDDSLISKQKSYATRSSETPGSKRRT